MSVKNATNIPLSLAVWLTTDTYDYNPDPYTISATSILKPIRELVLARSIPSSPDSEISDFIASRLGTAFHESIEQAWLNKPEEAMKKLGFPERVISLLRVNPKDNDEDFFDVHLEKRSKKKLGRWTVSGKFDQVVNGKLEDNKSTMVYNYIHQGNALKYTQQGSIYRWLNPELITDPFLQINYLFTDWKGHEVSKPNYPPHKIHTQDFELMSLEDTERLIQSKLNMVDHFESLDQSVLPHCTPEELWQKDSVFKYYKDPNKRARSTKNFTSLADANLRLVADGTVGTVYEQKGEIKYCKYCSANSVCTQKDQYILDGLLKI